MMRLLTLNLLVQLAAAAVSNLHIAQLGVTLAINLPPNSNDVNFYMTAPTYYSYVAMGFGAQMAGSLMLVAYPAADGRHVTVSPRVASGNWEPQFDPGYHVRLNGNSTVYGDYIVASGTCVNCRAWAGGSLDSATTSQPMMYALGPAFTPLADNSQAATIKRHTAYGRFLLNTIQATGYGGTGVLTSIDNSVNTGTQPVNTYGSNSANGVVEHDGDHLGLAHGVTLAVAALVLAPVDLVLGSGHLLSSFPILHAISSLVYLLLLIAGFGMGIRVSGEYVVTQHFATAHQILGFIVFFLGLLLLGLGIALHVGRSVSAAGERRPVNTVHMWGTRLLWLLVLIDGGLGLQLADASLGVTVGYIVFAGVTFLAVVFVLSCLWCIGGRRLQSRGSDAPYHVHNTRKSVGSRKTSADSEPVAEPHAR